MQKNHLYILYTNITIKKGVNMKIKEKVMKIINIRGMTKIIAITIVVILICFISIYIQNKEMSSIKINDKEFIKEKGKIAVYISGAINNTGIFYLSEGIRLDEALNIIGGIKDDADLNKINLSKVLYDSEKIVIPYKQKETIEEIKNEENNHTDNDEKEKIDSDDKININTANEQLLMQLSGIGEATSKKIVEYRKNGNFESIEEIMNVPGIGNSKFEKMKDKITVE